MSADLLGAAHIGNAFLYALLSTDGTKTEPAATGFVTLGVGTYLFPIVETIHQSLESIQISTDGTIVGVFTIETCNFPSGFETDHNVAAGNKWIQQNPSGVYVPSTGTGWTISGLTFTKTAGVGSASVDIGNLGKRRTRVKAVISTGGTVAIPVHGKVQ